MPPIVLRYQLDPTGISPNNLVQNEQVTLNGRSIRSVAPQYGAFFDESLVITDMISGLVLQRDVQWYPGELYEVPTALYGKGVYGIIIITDPTVSNTLSMQYQAVGGEFSTSAQAVAQLVDALSVDARPVTWGNLVNKPADYPPSQHLHNVGDVFGFEYLVHGLERVRAAIEFGNEAANLRMYAYIDKRMADVGIPEDVVFFNNGN